jgi:glycosyltransferase involved in cell wall biosynthesis
VAVLSDAAPGRNGVGVYYQDLVHHMERRGCQMRFFGPPADADADFRGVRIPMPGDPTQALYFPWLPTLWREVRAFRPDVIVGATPFLYGLSAIPLARLCDASLCLAYHTQFDKLAELYWRWGPTRLMAPLLGWWDRFVLGFADRVLVNNEELAAASGSGDRVRLVCTPVDPAFLDEPPPAPRAIRRILFVGRLAAEKRPEQVVAAARAHPGVHVQVAGDGPEGARMQAAARDIENLEYLGWCDRQRVRELLDESDALVLPSHFETFGTAAYEAMLRRRAVIVTPECGLAKWPELASGLFVMEEDETVVEALHRLAELPGDLVARRASNARTASMEYQERTLSDWLRVLSEAAPESRR